MEEMFLTPDELVARYKGKISKRTLANWRSQAHGEGPTPTKIGGRVLYKLTEVLKWEDKRTRLAGAASILLCILAGMGSCSL